MVLVALVEAKFVEVPLVVNEFVEDKFVEVELVAFRLVIVPVSFLSVVMY